MTNPNEALIERAAEILCKLRGQHPRQGHIPAAILAGKHVTKLEVARANITDALSSREGQAITQAQQELDAEPDLSKPPCIECGANNEKESEQKCICSGDKDNCQGCELWN